jgi:D-arabinose 1-dehydrogenase-like Zn-dependent alcohol dehydrogenase
MEAAPIDVLCMACSDEGCDFKPTRMKRRPLGPFDILIDVHFCGVCHSDLHQAAGHLKRIFGRPEYPYVAGHELSGVVAQVGHSVSKFRVGDHAGVGCMVDSCLKSSCKHCSADNEQLCERQVQAYGSWDWSGRAAQVPAGRQTIGGYSDRFVVQERFALRIPKTYPLEKAGPIMCAGVSCYEPLKRLGAKLGTRVGVVGLGGLGVMAVKLARAMGCVVTVVSRSRSKAALARSAGADDYLDSSDEEQMGAARASLDIVLDFVPCAHDYTAYAALLASEGKLVLLGLTSAWAAAMMLGGVTAGGACLGSFIGGIRSTQEVLDLCDRKKIYPETQLYPVSQLGKILELLDASNEAGTRSVLDIRGSLTERAFETCTAPPPRLRHAAAADQEMRLPAIAKEALYMKLCVRSPH